MGQVPGDATEEPPPAPLWAVRQWRLWELPTRVAAPIIALELLTVGAVAILGIGSPGPTSRDWFFAAAITGLGILHTETVLHVERVRRRLGDSNHVDLSSVWTFSGALVLPPALAVLVAVLVHIHVWGRAGEPPRVPVYRALFSTTTVVLACIAASVIMREFGPLVPIAAGGNDNLLIVVVALFVYTLVNSGLIAAAIAATIPNPTVKRAFGLWEDNMLEIATLALGGLAAIALSLHPGLILLVILPLLVLHRSVLVRHLEHAASTDSKTGLLNAAAWHTRAEHVIQTAFEGRRLAVLVLDLDHFKSINDTYGHLVGDEVLAAVAGALRGEVRENDLIGRFGGEEFVVLLADGQSEVAAVAERLRSRISTLRLEIPTPDGPLSVDGLSVSVGGALFPRDGTDLTSLLRVADSALYQVKRTGRNAVHMGTAVAQAEGIEESVRHPMSSDVPPNTSFPEPPASS